MSSRVREKAKKAEQRAAATGAARRDPIPLSVAVALGFLAAFIALRGGDLQLTAGPLFWGAVITILITFAVGIALAMGDRRAYLVARPVGILLTIALIAAPFAGYPAPALRLWSMAAALAGMVIALSLPSAKSFYRATGLWSWPR